MAQAYAAVMDLVKRMEAKAHKGFSVTAETADLVIKALRHYAQETLGETPRGYAVEIWNDRAGTMIAIHDTQTANLTVARAAFKAAALQNPRVLVTLRQRARVLLQSQDVDGTPAADLEKI